MKKIVLFLLLAPVVLHTSCTTPQTTATVLTDADSNKTIEVAMGQEIELHLKANSSTGYAWKYLDTTQETVRLVNDKYETDPRYKNANGAGGTHVFRFKAAKPGTSAINMLYSRSWEPDAWVQRYKVTMLVK